MLKDIGKVLQHLVLTRPKTINDTNLNVKSASVVWIFDIFDFLYLWLFKVEQTR